MSQHSLSFRFGILLATAAAGCSGEKAETRLPISHSTAALTVQQNAEQALRGALDAGGFLAESRAMAQSLSQLGGSSESCSATLVAPDCTGGTTGCDPTSQIEETCISESDQVTVDDLEGSRQELSDAIGELVQRLKHEVFTDANLESDTGSEVVYRLGPDVLCAETDEEASAVSVEVPTAGTQTAVTAPQEPTIDPQCAATVAKLEPRLRLTSPGEGDIDVAFLLTSRKTNPITLEFYHDRLGVVLDLDELQSLLEAADEMPESVDALEGRVSVELVKNAERDYSLRGNVLEDLLVTAGDEGKKVTVRLGASSPTGELRLDGNARTITGSYDMSTLSMTAPLDVFRSDDEVYDENGDPVVSTTYTGLITLLLGGLNGSLTFDGNTDVLNLLGLGLGDVSTTVHHDGDLLFKLDVNPDNGRRFDLQLQSGTEGTPTLTFSPTLDVRVQLAFQKLADQIPDLDSFLLNDTMRLWFEGASPSVLAGDNSLRVVSGTLHMDSQNAPESSVTVEAGMCLVQSDTPEEQAASLSSAFVSGVCE